MISIAIGIAIDNDSPSLAHRIDHSIMNSIKIIDAIHHIFILFSFHCMPISSEIIIFFAVT
jgi:hypothetical protein